MAHEIRGLTPQDIENVADIWFQGWHDAHAAITPEALVRLRSRADFVRRLGAHMPDVRVCGAPEVLGFYQLDGDEVEQFYVAPDARGKGVAAALMADAEAQLRQQGYERIWLACAIGNDRAARFYEKTGWQNMGQTPVALETSAGDFTLDVWRFEKPLI